MTTTVEAIYERGVLRLKEPISLVDGEQVEVIVIARDRPAEEMKPAEVLASIAALPPEGETNGFSGREHDQILYGKEDAR